MENLATSSTDSKSSRNRRTFEVFTRRRSPAHLLPSKVIFTMKKLLDKLSQQSSNSQTQPGQVARRVSIRGSGSSNIPQHISAFVFFVKSQNISRVQGIVSL